MIVAQCSTQIEYADPNDTASAVAPIVDMGGLYRFSIRKKSMTPDVSEIREEGHGRTSKKDDGWNRMDRQIHP